MGRLRKRRKNVWVNEIDAIVRGACGGFLIGIPLLYTMEVWWIGSFVEPLQMMVAIATSFIAVFLLNRTAGFRKMKCIKVSDAVMDTVVAIAIGLVCATFVLILLREITPDVPLDEALGKILFESVPFSLGVALANQFLSDARSEDKDESNGQQDDGEDDELNATLADVGATLIGSAIIAFNISPTEEVPMLAAAVSGPWLLAIIAASLLISYGIVFEAGFADQKKRMQQQGIFQKPLSETVASYLVSLVAAAFMLWFFQQLDFNDPWTIWLRYTLILGLPSTVGGAAGRLAL